MFKFFASILSDISNAMVAGEALIAHINQEFPVDELRRQRTSSNASASEECNRALRYLPHVIQPGAGRSWVQLRVCWVLDGLEPVQPDLAGARIELISAPSWAECRWLSPTTGTWARYQKRPNGIWHRLPDSNTYPE